MKLRAILRREEKCKNAIIVKSGLQVRRIITMLGSFSGPVHL